MPATWSRASKLPVSAGKLSAGVRLNLVDGMPDAKADPRLGKEARREVTQCVPIVNRCADSSFGGKTPPLLKFQSLGRSFLGLLDSGSSVSLLGDAAIALCKERRVTTKSSRTVVRFGRGTSQVAGTVRLIMRWAGGKRRQRFLLVPGLSPAVILGRDFLAGSEMDLRISDGGWTCGSFPRRLSLSTAKLIFLMVVFLVL